MDTIDKHFKTPNAAKKKKKEIAGLTKIRISFGESKDKFKPYDKQWDRGNDCDDQIIEG